MAIDLSNLVTESRNHNSENIDTLSTLGMLKVINNEDKKVPLAVEKVLPEIAQLIDKVAIAFSQGGRLIYCGAGTSGRLGILDASECPPTYGTPHEMVIGLIAGGHKAILQAVENAEDNAQLGEEDLRQLNFNKQDILVGIAASGRTPYVIGALNYAKSLGATTGAMIKIGKVFGNLMVDVEATNAKLVERQIRIVMQATECERAIAEDALSQCHRHCKTAILMILANVDAQQATQMLTQNRGFIRKALGE
ncbi:N-acetylmuramic acid 6-phosphate etherase [Proteus sp. G2662]|uniref:N-acetylmuramic acid 6-phosphate etherase n=1 Tax=Proteus sp. G2662 TaxID=2698875 RepID=UPI001378A7F7|nr:N-acetylmuramic acid 6-phosphate etherase [Proteus sp. G2662]NBM92456.1 N-acetylmuramic acid 6-phosphate etherase [Proteus sp. G2662]